MDVTVPFIEDTSYSFQHFSSSSDGLVLTVDSVSGDILWERNFGSPIVAMYILEGDGLHRLPFTVIGMETLISLIEVNIISTVQKYFYISTVQNIFQLCKKVYF